ncbi:MAG: tRNA pseudouridine(54/55) synthase Pus10 [Candidatus Thorarchaeota archaeon]
MTGHDEHSMLETAQKMLIQHALCDRCLGRLFAWLGTGTSNEARGYSIKLTLCMIADDELKSGNKESGERAIAILAGNGMFAPAKTIATKNSIEFEGRDNCHLCFIEGHSIFDRISNVAERMIGIADQVEFETFLAGSIPSPLLVERQDELTAIYSTLYSETLKSHFNRLMGIQLQELLEKPVDFEKPDVVFVYDMDQDEVQVKVNPIFIYGRYRKLARGIPQSRWDCKKCKGKGCKECGETGRNYPDSISEYVGVPAKECAGGSRFKFHAAGREDVDVLMLGKGRPFVVEISEPRVRRPNLLEMTQTINQEATGKIEVHDMELADRHRLQKLKESASSNIKEYAAVIQTEGLVTDEDIQRVIQSLRDATIEQRTPNRVSHRRSDLIREKKVHEVQLTRREDGVLEAFFKVQGGTYIKELISGDEGRTKPSIAEILGTPCLCKELNVTAIYGGVD